jgi:hypothetical protein
MRILACLALIAGTLITSQAQQPSNATNNTATASAAAQETTNLAILKYSWVKERIPGWEINPFGASVEDYEAMRARVDQERRLQQARNTGNRAEAQRVQRDIQAREDATYKKKVEENRRPRDGYRYKVRVRNTSDKTIKLVDWDYVFLDPDTQNEVTRYQFTSEEKIRPGKETELDVFILSPPVRVVNARAAEKNEQVTNTERIEMVRIEYSDGTVWQRP